MCSGWKPFRNFHRLDRALQRMCSHFSIHSWGLSMDWKSIYFWCWWSEMWYGEKMTASLTTFTKLICFRKPFLVWNISFLFLEISSAKTIEEAVIPFAKKVSNTYTSKIWKSSPKSPLCRPNCSWDASQTALITHCFPSIFLPNSTNSSAW